MPGLNSKPFRSIGPYMLRKHIILLIAIRPSDGDVKPGGPLGAFREEQAMSRQRVSPSPLHSSSSHYTNSYTYSYPNLNFLLYTIQILVPHVMWSAKVVRDLKIDHTQHHARNPKHVIVQWVGIWNIYSIKWKRVIFDQNDRKFTH